MTTRFTYTDLPGGLGTLAYKTDDDIDLLIARALPPADQRAACRSAVRAARRRGWIRPHEQMMLLLPIAGASIRHVSTSLLAHLTTAKGIATAAAATLAVGVAAAAITVTPTINLHIIPVRPSPPHAASRGHTVDRARKQTTRLVGAKAKGTTHLAVLGSGTPAPTTSSLPSPAPPSPSPSVSVRVTTSPTPVCLVNLLGIQVCL